MSTLQDITHSLADWLDLPPWPTPASIRLQQEAEAQQAEQTEPEDEQ
jgi:hypothetical protein